MKFSSFSRSTEDLTITLQNDIPIENVGTIKYYQDNASGIFSKKEFRWSFNNEYWSSWQTLTQVALTAIDTYVNYYFFLQIRYTLTAVGSGTVTTFELNYLNGTAVAVTPRILTEDIQHLDASAVLIHDILQTYEVVTIRDASLLNGYSGNYYLDRQHHVGHQTISSITGLQAILDNTATVGAYVKEASLGTDFTWVNGLLDVSVTSGYSTTYIDGSLNAKTDFTYTVKQDVSIGLKADKTYVDTSLNNLGIKDANIDTSLNALWVKEGNQDSSLLLYVKKAGDTMSGNLTINASLNVNGNVGINTVPNITFPLDVAGSIKGTNIYSTAALQGNTISSYTPNTDLTIQTYTDGKNVIFNNRTGKVGIGINNPSTNLDVSGNFHTTGAAWFDGSIQMKSQRILGLALPIDSSDAVNKLYVDSSLDNKVPYNGATSDVYLGAHNMFTLGTLGVNTLAPSKQLEVNSVDGNNLRLTYNDNNGSPTYYTDFDLTGFGNLMITTVGGQIILKNNERITGLGLPTDSSDAVNKFYVDSSFPLKSNIDASLLVIYARMADIEAISMAGLIL